MIKVILIDDEPLSCKIIQSYLSHYTQFHIVQQCHDGFEGLKAIQEHKPDLIFLDIQMPKISGFEMLELIDNPPDVIFSTAFDEYAIKAFESNAVDYLLKPFSEERFKTAIEKFLAKSGSVYNENTNNLLEAMSVSNANQNRIVVKTGTKVKIIPLHEVHYLEADDDYVRIVTKEGEFLKNKTMSYYEKNLDPLLFVRTHRSYIVNIDQITRIDPYQKDTHMAVLRNAKQIPVSKSGYIRLKQVLGF